jgi:hypothetical protein
VTTTPNEHRFAVHLETRDVVETLDAISAEIRRLSALPLLPEFRERLVQLVEAACRSVRPLHVDHGPAGTRDLRLTLKSPKGLLDLLSALRAWDGNLDFVFDGHALDGTDPVDAGREGSAA